MCRSSRHFVDPQFVLQVPAVQHGELRRVAAVVALDDDPAGVVVLPQCADEAGHVDEAALGAELVEPALDPPSGTALEHRRLRTGHPVLLAGVGVAGVLEVHVGDPLGVLPVEGHRVDAADRQLRGVEREPDRGRVGGGQQPAQLVGGVHRAEAVVVQGETDAGGRGQLADPVPHLADDLDAVGVQRRRHPGRADRADDELLGTDAGDEVDERLGPLDDRVGVGGVGRRCGRRSPLPPP